MGEITSKGGWGSPGSDPIADIQAAKAKMREWAPPPMVISPRAAQAVNQVLERPENTPISKPDLHKAIDVLYQRATPEEQERMFEYSLALQWRGSYG